MSIKGVIFDFNGTLLWDTQLHNTAWDIFLNKHGISLTDEKKHQQIHGKLNTEIMRYLFGNKLESEEMERYILEKESIYQELCMKTDDFSLAEGTIALFEKLKEKEIPFVIATAADLVNVDFYIRTFHLYKWFKKEYIIYNDGTVRGKPFPDIFLKALDVLGIEGEEAVIFEDSISGIKAAEAAGAGRIIIVNSNDSDYTEFKDKHTIINNFNEVEITE